MSLEAKWNTNEMLLQSYRTIFISSQSFLLAFGGYLVGKADSILLIMCFVSFYVIYEIWIPVVVARHRIVDYYKFQIDLDAQSKADLDALNISVEQYLNDPSKRTDANKIFGIATNWRTTRYKMDKQIPCIFSLIWAAMAVIVALNHFVFATTASWI